MKQKFFSLMLVFTLLLWCSTVVRASLIFDLKGVNDSNLSAHVDFDYTPSTGTISIDIKNTSLFGGGPDPRLTAFAFNVPEPVTGVSNFSGSSGWGAFFNEDSINTPGKFGYFDIAGITGPNFNGGNANDGIARNSTYSFNFVLTGSGLEGLQASDFLNQYSADPKNKEDEQYFIARFQRTGANGNGSDVAVPTGSPVPEPATMLLLGTGLAGLAGFRKKLKK
jgi:hypothetical protein